MMDPAFARPHAIKLAFVALLTTMFTMLFGAAPSESDAASTRTFRPIDRMGTTFVYNVAKVSDKKVRKAWVRVRRDGERRRRSVRARRVERAARATQNFRVRARRAGKLELKLAAQTEPSVPAAEEPSVPAADCAPNPAEFMIEGCGVAFEDPGTQSDAIAAGWRAIECGFVNAPILSRHEQFDTGGAPLPGGTAGESSYRRLTVFDGDDFYGERCELGVNEHRPDHDPNPVVYREGERWITEILLRLPENYPLGSTKWQTVMQMKQAQPSAGGGGAPAMELQAKGGRWYMIAAWNDLWSAPATKSDWTHFAFDVHYSQHASEGTINVYVDLNGDGDALDAGEQSPTMQTATLKREVEGGWSGDGIAPGESIPSHLRTGVYHDPALPCEAGCSLDVDNIQAVRVE